jgi:hypothetical protein
VGVFAGPDVSESGLVLALDAGNVKSSYKNFIKAKVYSVYNGGLRSANYSVQYSDDNGNWTTAFSGICSNNTSCGIQENTGLGNGSYGYRRYWRYVEGSAVVSHHPRVSRIILTDVNGVDYNLIVYTSDNCSDTGTYIVGTVSVDFATNIWTDLTGRGNNGTLTNGPTYNSVNGGNISFDGSNDYIDCGNSSNLSITVGTVCAWFKKSHGSGYKGLVDKGRDGYGAWSLNVDEAANTATFKARISDGNNRSIIASSSYGNDIWTYVCGIYDGTNLSIYQNGTLSNSAQYSGTIGTNSISVRVGSANDGLYFNGNIAQVSIYNRALTAAEIQQNFNATRSRFGI